MTLLLAALAMNGCATMRDGAAIQEPIVTLAGLRVRDVQLFEQRYTVVLRVQNPNPVELPIRGMSYQMLLNKVELGRGASPQSVVIPPYGESLVEVDLTSNAFSLAQRVKDIVGGLSDGVRVSISGNMNLSNRTQPLPFSFTGDLGGGRS